MRITRWHLFRQCEAMEHHSCQMAFRDYSTTPAIALAAEESACASIPATQCYCPAVWPGRLSVQSLWTGVRSQWNGEVAKGFIFSSASVTTVFMSPLSFNAQARRRSPGLLYRVSAGDSALMARSRPGLFAAGDFVTPLATTHQTSLEMTSAMAMQKQSTTPDSLMNT